MIRTYKKHHFSILVCDSKTQQAINGAIPEKIQTRGLKTYFLEKT